ncbi:hypothetical protein D3C87_2070760 [compost metagenome]
MFPAVHLLYVFSARRAHGVAQLRVQDQGFQALGSSVGVTDGHDKACHAIQHDLGGAVGVGHHDR